MKFPRELELTMPSAPGMGLRLERRDGLILTRVEDVDALDFTLSAHVPRRFARVRLHSDVLEDARSPSAIASRLIGQGAAALIAEIERDMDVLRRGGR